MLNCTNFTNTHILGTSLSASQANYTYVNNISAQGNVVATGNVYGNTFIEFAIRYFLYRAVIG